MSKPTLTKADLVKAVQSGVGVTSVESRRLVDTVLDTMKDALQEEGRLKISRFGTFLVRDKSARIGRNPLTMEDVVITPRKVLVFRVSTAFREALNRGGAQ